jgi:hypothetical protein
MQLIKFWGKISPSKLHPTFQRKASTESDGCWWCCRCRGEHTISRYDGKYPLGDMDCTKCKHVFCKRCHATDIFQVNENSLPSLVPVPHFTTQLAPYGQICPRCGLTHRAKIRRMPGSGSDGDKISWVDFKVTCACGQRSSDTWLRFSIGDNKDWLVNPLECYQRSLDKLLEQSTQRLIERRAQAGGTGQPSQTPIRPARRMPGIADPKLPKIGLLYLHPPPMRPPDGPPDAPVDMQEGAHERPCTLVRRPAVRSKTSLFAQRQQL